MSNNNNKDSIFSSHKERKHHLQELEDDLNGIIKRENLSDKLSYTLDKKGNYSFDGPVNKYQLFQLAREFEENLLVDDSWNKIFRVTKEIKNYLRLIFFGYSKEIFSAMFLDSNDVLIELKKLSYGEEDFATIHYNKILKLSILLDARSIIIIHNHPSGSCRPSDKDKLVTKELQKLLLLTGILLKDHIIVSDYEVYSFKESGLL